ncbi:MAG: hypothetical protein M3159_02350 [Actinomycetota bacterium]|nr:hypothetical protein [Actinomycetota bacterium]
MPVTEYAARNRRSGAVLDAVELFADIGFLVVHELGLERFALENLGVLLLLFLGQLFRRFIFTFGDHAVKATRAGLD